MSKKAIANVLLVLTALIWGCAFVAQNVGMDHVQPFTFTAARSFIGAIVLLPVIFVMDKSRAKKAAENGAAVPKINHKTLWLGGILCGAALCAGSCTQQLGISLGTGSGKAGFLTALYIVIVPLLGLFLKKKVPAAVWVSVVLALGGLFLLSVQADFSVAVGDIYLIICALLFSVHILVIDHFSPLVDGVRMSCIQFLVCGVISAVLAFAFETPQLSGLMAAAVPILYAGVMSSGVAYTLQIVAQKNTDPTLASLLLSLESVFAVISGAIILHERLSPRESIGCVLVFAAVLLAQLPQSFFTRAKEKAEG